MNFGRHRADRRIGKSDVVGDPLHTAAMARYLRTRSGHVSVAVEDLADAVTEKRFGEWLLDPDDRFQTASIVKTDILETLLHQSGGPLRGGVAEIAAGMIEDSDDADATDLWSASGGASAIAAYNRAAGLTQTTPNDDGYWGETYTSAADQIKLLANLALPSKLLSRASQRYALDLMDHVAPGQDWGVTGGVPSRVTVALKNGWVPLTSYSDWEINSIGWVHGDGRDYLIAVLTAHDPSEQYGIETIQKLSALIFRSLSPAA